MLLQFGPEEVNLGGKAGARSDSDGSDGDLSDGGGDGGVGGGGGRSGGGGGGDDIFGSENGSQGGGDGEFRDDLVKKTSESGRIGKVKALESMEEGRCVCVNQHGAAMAW